MKQRWGLDRNVLRPTPGDPWGVEQHHWNTGAKENQQLNPGGPSNRQKSSGPNQLNKKLYVGAIIESDARPTGVQLKREAKLLTVIGLNTKHASWLTFLLKMSKSVGGTLSCAVLLSFA